MPRGLFLCAANMRLEGPMVDMVDMVDMVARDRVMAGADT